MDKCDWKIDSIRKGITKINPDATISYISLEEIREINCKLEKAGFSITNSDTDKMLEIQGEWIVDMPRARVMKVKTEALRSGRNLDEKDFISIILFKELQEIIDVASQKGFKNNNDCEDLEKDFEKRLKEKDKIIEQLHKTIEYQLRTIALLDFNNQPRITINEKGECINE